jgi:hypothetical protein
VDSIEAEIEENEKIKLGRYNSGGVWTCNDCIATSQRQEKRQSKMKIHRLPLYMSERVASMINKIP